MRQRSIKTLGDSPIGTVLRVLREYRGLSLEETARLVGVSAGNLSRTERGLSGGLHPRHLERITCVLGTSMAALHALVEAIALEPDLLDEPDELVARADRLAEVQRAYLRLSKKQRQAVDRLLKI